MTFQKVSVLLVTGLFTLTIAGPAAAQRRPAEAKAERVEERKARKQMRRDAKADKVERKQTKRDIKRGKQAMPDDRQDLNDAQRLHAAYQAARKSNDMASIAQLDQVALKLMRQEVAESKKEVVGAAVEKKQSKAELGRSRRDMKNTKGPKVKKAAQRADDRRDLNDDKRDLKKEKNELGNVQKMIAQYERFAGKTDVRALDIKEKMIKGMIKGERREIRRDKKELAEDRGERRENKKQRAKPLPKKPATRR